MTHDPLDVPALKDTLRRVAHFTTRLQPVGISIRFLNHDEGDGRGYDDLVDVDEIAKKVDGVPFSGGTRLGEVLNEKIVQPMIIDKIIAGKLERPMFVVIITDGKVRVVTMLHIWIPKPYPSHFNDPRAFFSRCFLLSKYFHSLLLSPPKASATRSATAKTSSAVTPTRMRRPSSSSRKLAPPSRPRRSCVAWKQTRRLAARSSVPPKIWPKSSRGSKAAGRISNIRLG